MKKQAKFSYSHLRKALEKQMKTVKSQCEKQVKEFEKHGKDQLNLISWLNIVYQLRIFSLPLKIFHLISWIMNKIDELHHNVDFKNLI